MYAKKPEPRFTALTLTILTLIALIALTAMLGCTSETFNGYFAAATNEANEKAARDEYAKQELYWGSNAEVLQRGCNEILADIKETENALAALEEDMSNPDELKAVADRLEALKERLEETAESLENTQKALEELQKNPYANQEKLTALGGTLMVASGTLNDSGNRIAELEDRLKALQDALAEQQEQEEEEEEKPLVIQVVGQPAGSGSDESDDDGDSLISAPVRCPGCGETGTGTDYPHAKCPVCQVYMCINEEGHPLHDCGHILCIGTGENGTWESDHSEALCSKKNNTAVTPAPEPEVQQPQQEQLTPKAKVIQERRSAPLSQHMLVCDYCAEYFNFGDVIHSYYTCGSHYYCEATGMQPMPCPTCG